MYKRQVLRGRVDILKGKDLLMVVYQRIGLRYMTSLGLRRGFLIKSLPSSLSLGITGCLTLSRKNGRDTSSPKRRSTCALCGKGHVGACLVETGICFGCGKIGHYVMDPYF